MMPSAPSPSSRSTVRHAAVLAGAVVLLAALFVPIGPAQALNTVTVTTTADGGPGSLRAAFDTANTDGDDTTIVLAADEEYRLTICGPDDDSNAAGDLDHTAADDLTITGNMSFIVQTCAGQRVMHQLADGALLIDTAALTGGTPDGDGGGLLVDGSGPSSFVDSLFLDNTASGDGGGVEAPALSTVLSDGTAYVENEAGGEGGGLDASVGGADTVIIDSLFLGNSAFGDVGGGATLSGGSATSVVIDSQFSDNYSADEGGGLYVSGASSEISITGSTFSGNTAEESGGGLQTGGDGPPKVVTNSTFVGNDAGISGGGIDGGFALLDLTYLTITGNDAPSGASVATTGDLAVFGTILADPLAGTNCSVGSSTSAGYNWSTDDSCGLAATGDTEDAGDPELEPLGDYGGLTETRVPSFGSPMVDAIPAGDCAPGITDDQRGEPRPDGEGCDIGAVEGEGDELIPPSPDPDAFDPVNPSIAPAAAAEPVGQTPAFTG